MQGVRHSCDSPVGHAVTRQKTPHRLAVEYIASDYVHRWLNLFRRIGISADRESMPTEYESKNNDKLGLCMCGDTQNACVPHRNICLRRRHEMDSHGHQWQRNFKI